MSDDLGNSLSQHILKKECDFEMAALSGKPRRVQKKKMEDLVKAYSQAIEYYQSIESDHFADMTVKMQQFLIKPEVLALMTDTGEEEKDIELPPLSREDSNDESGKISSRLRKFVRMPTPMSANKVTKNFKSEGR